MNLKKLDRILILAPHTDDSELGLGGTIAYLVENDVEIHSHAFSNASKSLPKDMAENTLEVEYRNAMDVLGLPKKNIFVHNYEARTFSYFRQEILDEIYRIRKDFQPDLVFLPSTYDLHQDHEVISREGLRCFKTTGILGYELPWNNMSFQTNCFVRLQERHIERKIEALKCYASQRYRSYVNESFIRSLAVTRGVQIQVKYAEAFEIIRLILI